LSVTDPTRRHLTVAVLAGVASGGLMLLGATRPWSTIRVSAPGVPADVVTVTGSQAVPLTTALALVVLAGVLAVVPTGGRLRRAVGGVVAAAGVATALLAGLADGAVRTAVADAVARSPATLGDEVAIGAPGPTSWRWVTVVAAVGAAGVGVATARRGHRWAVMGSRYDAPTSTAKTAADTDAWRAIDAGEDPTA